MTISGNGRSDDNGGDKSGSDDATRIISWPDEGGDDATRIITDDGDQTAGNERGQVIGVADQGQPRAPDGSAPSSDSEKTVMLPGGHDTPKQPVFDPVVAWLAIVDGPGRGGYCAVYYGQNSIGRGPDQRIQLDFGDTRISRDSHAFLIYDDIGRKFFIRDNGKTNLVRLNEAPVMAPTEISARDQIAIGNTTLLFMPLCGPDFDWLASDDQSGGDTGQPDQNAGQEPSDG